MPKEELESAHLEHYSENDEVFIQKSEHSLKDNSLLVFTDMSKPNNSTGLRGTICSDHVNMENDLDGNCPEHQADDPKLQEMNITEEFDGHPVLKSSDTFRNYKYQHQVSSSSFRTSCYGQLLRDYFVPVNYFI